MQEFNVHYLDAEKVYRYVRVPALDERDAKVKVVNIVREETKGAFIPDLSTMIAKRVWA